VNSAIVLRHLAQLRPKYNLLRSNMALFFGSNVDKTLLATCVFANVIVVRGVSQCDARLSSFTLPRAGFAVSRARFTRMSINR